MISMQAVAYRYGRGKPLFENLGLDLKPGNIYGLLGRNGAGKTTLLKLVAGLLMPRGGTVTAFGKNVTKRLPSVLREIFFLPETFGVPTAHAIAYKNAVAPFYPNFDETRFFENMNMLEIETNVAISRMSYGQQKKFMIAFGLACNCSLNILDEPTNGLDIPSKSQFRKLIAASAGDDRCFVISTHQARDLQGLIDPVIVIEGGHVVFNHEMFEVEQKLRFRTVHNEPGSSALYAEKGFDSWTVVEPREGETRSDAGMDLELLFNAVVNSPDRVRKIMEASR